MLSIAMSRSRIRVAIADDHTLVRQGTHEILRHAPDIEVVGEAAQGEEAITLVETLEPDVLLLDVRMPGLNGIDVTRKVGEMSPKTRVLLLSAYDDVDYVVEALGAGAAGYLLKTTPGDELVEAVRAVHSGTSVLQDSLSRGLALRVARPDQGGPRLSDRELEVLRLTGRGLASKEIAAKLQISQRTVEGHLNNIYAKLGVNSRTEAVVQAASRGLIRLEQL